MHKRQLIQLGATALLLGGPLLAAWALRPADSTGPCVADAGPSMLAEIPESSGLAVSRRNPGVLWSHNDSGHAAVLFAIDTRGTVLGRVRVPIRTRDWEDVSAADCSANPCLYIADIGDNRTTRPQIRIYRVPEPAPADAETAPPELLEGTYSDGPHNAEAMFIVGTDFFIVTRDRVGGVYKAQRAAGRHLTFHRIGELGLAAVTDAETSSNEKFVVVRNYREAILYRTEDVIRGGNVPHARIPLDGLRESQGEGVALDGSFLFLSSEGRPWNRGGSLITLRCIVSP